MTIFVALLILLVLAAFATIVVLITVVSTPWKETVTSSTKPVGVAFSGLFAHQLATAVLGVVLICLLLVLFYGWPR